jgi:WbqC-like protein family
MYSKENYRSLLVLALLYQQFQPSEYPQSTTEAFTPGVSMIDVLMNCGFARARVLAESSVYRG